MFCGPAPVPQSRDLQLKTLRHLSEKALKESPFVDSGQNDDGDVTAQTYT